MEAAPYTWRLPSSTSTVASITSTLVSAARWMVSVALTWLRAPAAGRGRGRSRPPAARHTRTLGDRDENAWNLLAARCPYGLQRFRDAAKRSPLGSFVGKFAGSAPARGRSGPSGTKALRLRLVRRLVVDVAHELGQAGVPEELAVGHVLARVLPVVVDDALQQVPDEAAARLAVLAGVRLLEHVAVERVEPGVGALGDVAPRRPHLLEGRSAGRRARAEPFVDVRVRHLALAVVEEVLLLLPRQVADAPAQAVEREEPLHGVLRLDGAQGAGELAPGEPELLDEGMRRGGHGLKVTSTRSLALRIEMAVTPPQPIAAVPMTGCATVRQGLSVSA